MIKIPKNKPCFQEDFPQLCNYKDTIFILQNINIKPQSDKQTPTDRKPIQLFRYSVVVEVTITTKQHSTDHSVNAPSTMVNHCILKIETRH